MRSPVSRQVMSGPYNSCVRRYLVDLLHNDFTNIINTMKHYKMKTFYGPIILAIAIFLLLMIIS